jgi:quercetin dioxygenase-like cupin family protein
MKASGVDAHAAWIVLGVVLGVAIVSARAVSGSTQPQSSERARVILTHSLPQLEGDHLKATVVEVHYGPGESSPQHSHPCPVIGYVVQGAYRTQVEGEPEAVYRAGQTFYEAPKRLHLISANASKTEPAAFIAVFVCDRDSPLSANVPLSNGKTRNSQ